MCIYVCYCLLLFDNLFVYSMSEQCTFDTYRHLDSYSKSEGTSSQPTPSGYSADTE
ncbi:hypothetical protein Hanom_Chr11g01042681 [Helianthus anomalus]